MALTKVIGRGLGVQGDTVAGDDAAIGFTSAEGLILTGQGSTSDVIIKNDADTTVCFVPTGTDDLKFNDNAAILLGTDSDMQIIHDGSNSIISDNGTGNLVLRSNASAVEIDFNTDETSALFNHNGSVELYHDNSKKFETTSGGASVTGDISGSGKIALSGGTASSGDFTDGGIHFHDSSTSEDAVMPISFTPSATGNRARAAIGFISQQSGGTDGFAGAIGFYTRDAADGSALGTSDEKVRIDKSGNLIAHSNLCIGTTTADGKITLSGNSNPLARFTHTQNANEKILIITHTYASGSQQATMIEFRDAGGTIRGSIKTTGSSTSFNTSSDYRLKENVTYDFDATTRLKQLKPCRFNFIGVADNTVDGFLAHEVSSIVPEAIIGDKDAMTEEVLYVDGDEIPDGKKIGDVKEASVIDPQGIDQSKLVPLLVKTIQELEARITTLEGT
jgi:hypothetical protein